MARKTKLTRAERRERRAEVGEAGVYGVDAEDARADSWIGRYLCFAASPDEARARIRDAGFHKRRMWATWSPRTPAKYGPPPPVMEPGDGHWYRSRFDDSGWTPWEQLPADHRHPPQGQAASDPSLR